MSVNTYINRFDTWKDFINISTNAKANPKCTPQRASRHPKKSNMWDNTRADWYGSNTYEEALGFLHNGWKIGLKRLEEFRTKIPPALFDVVMPVRDYIPEQKHNIAGGIPDIGSYLTGATPENFITEQQPVDANPDSVQRGHKLVTIYYNLTFSCGASTDAMFYRGAYLYWLVHHLEQCGYSVELWVYSAVWETIRGGDNNGQRLNQRNYIKVKEFGDMFDDNKLAIALCSPFMFRRFVFSLQEVVSDDEMCIPNGHTYGHLDYGLTVQNIKLPEDKDLDVLCFTETTENKEAMEQVFKDTLAGYLNKPDDSIQE